MMYPGLASWAKFSRPCGTKLVNPGSHTRSKARTLPRFALSPDKHFVKTPSELWEFDHYLTRGRKAIDAKYDYRCSRLPILFGQLIQNGQITVDDLLGLAEDKLALVRPAYESWAIPKRSGCRLNDIDGEFLQRNRLPCTRDRNPCPDAGLVIGRCGVYGYPAESASSVVLRPAWVMQSEARSISGKCGACGTTMVLAAMGPILVASRLRPIDSTNRRPGASAALSPRIRVRFRLALTLTMLLDSHSGCDQDGCPDQISKSF